MCEVCWVWLVRSCFLLTYLKVDESRLAMGIDDERELLFK